jgi:multidrug efflux pump subunit AcrB
MFVVGLKAWADRPTTNLHVKAILASVQAKLSHITGATIQMFAPPSIPGISISGGIETYLQAYDDADPHKLENALQQFVSTLRTSGKFFYAFSSYTAKTPHIRLNVDRTKCEMFNVPVATLFMTLQNYLGSRYVNDVNLGTQINMVMIQSDWAYRTSPDDILKLYVRSQTGDMVPIGSLVTLETELSPRLVSRFNQYPAALVRALQLPFLSSSQAMETIRQETEKLPLGYGISWSGLSYQEDKASGQIGMLMLAALVFGFLFLVAN